jgi:hypothetical protein
VPFENPPPDHDPFETEEEKAAKRAKARGLGPKPEDPDARRAWYEERGRRYRRLATWTTLAGIVGGLLFAAGRLWWSETSRNDRAQRALAARDAWLAETYSITATVGPSLVLLEGNFATASLPWPQGDARGDAADAWTDLRATWDRALRAGRWTRLHVRVFGDEPHRASAVEFFRGIAAGAGVEFVAEDP